MDLARKRDRERLSIRREAYWQRLGKGAFLGFRRGPDTWLARYRGRDGVQAWQPLGEAIEFDEAKRRAEAWLAQLAGSPVRSAKRGTVREALKAYLTDLRSRGREGAATEAAWRFKVAVYRDPERKRADDDAIAELVLETATLDDFREWRERLRPGRQPRTVNRYVRAVVAGLNVACGLGYVGNPAAWQLAGLDDDVEASGETAIFLDVPQRRALIAAAAPMAGNFLRGMEVTGGRPIEIAAAKVSDFSGDSLRLAHRKGKPPKLRVRHVALGDEGIEFLTRMCKGRPPEAFLFTEDGEQQWRRHMWCRQVRSAIAAYNSNTSDNPIPVAASAYSFRHARISELLQVHGVDPLTVAAQTGTSLAMIEKAYLRFIPSAMRAKLAAVKNTPENSNQPHAAT